MSLISLIKLNENFMNVAVFPTEASTEASLFEFVAFPSRIPRAGILALNSSALQQLKRAIFFQDAN